MPSAKDIREFRGFLRQASDRQVQGIYDKEKSAGRDEYAELAVAEAERRGIELDNHSTRKRSKSPTQLEREIAKMLAPAPSRSAVAGYSNYGGGGAFAPMGSPSVGGTRSLVDTISAGSRVTIVDRFGKQRTGRAVMRGPYGWVLNMGGKHGTPAIASADNVVSVRYGK